MSPLDEGLVEAVYQVDRPLHHQLALDAYRQSFRFRNLTPDYESVEFRRLDDVFRLLQIGDPKLPTIKRPVDTFDLTNPYLGQKIVDACHQDLPTPARVKACLKSIDRYCQYLRDNPTVYIAGQNPIVLPDLYDRIESPVNRYSLPRRSQEEHPNRNYLTASEYKAWLQFTWRQTSDTGQSEWQHLKAAQIHLMCVIAGEMALRLQELLGLEPQHFNLQDDVCLVVLGKGSNGSGYRKREVPVSPMAKATLKDFLRQFPRKPDEPLFQGVNGQRLSKNVAHKWLHELIVKIRQTRLPIFIDKGFGWHAFRRTFTCLFLERGGNIFELKRITGWRYTSTISHYLGDAKKDLPQEGLYKVSGGMYGD